MVTKHIELYMFEMMLITGGVKGDQFYNTMATLDTVFEIGYKKGWEDAILKSLMRESKDEKCSAN